MMQEKQDGAHQRWKATTVALGALAGVEDDDMDLVAHASTATRSKEKALERQETSLDAGVEGREAHPCGCGRVVCSLVLGEHLAFPLNYRARSSGSREWNEGELRKKMTRLDGLSTEEKHARRAVRKWQPRRENGSALSFSP